MAKYSDEIEKLEQRMEQLRQRQRDLKAKETRQQRADDTRRKILYGAAFLAAVQNLSEEKRAQSLARLHARIRNPKDRAFLGLPKLD
ncbi:MAG: hypothetical protein ACU0FH_20460 [Heliomarina sp.]|uniref:hypothetical protein n=1 Tax=Heliomarina sp. TaxID=2917556 RepID=UPI004057EC4C